MHMAVKLSKYFTLNKNFVRDYETGAIILTPHEFSCMTRLAAHGRHSMPASSMDSLRGGTIKSRACPTCYGRTEP